MKKVINVLKQAIKYGSVLMACIKIVEFATEQFENINEKHSQNENPNIKN